MKLEKMKAQHLTSIVKNFRNSSVTSGFQMQISVEAKLSNRFPSIPISRLFSKKIALKPRKDQTQNMVSV